MKFKTGDILYYINPFVFIIDKVSIEFVDEIQNGEQYYVDYAGAYLGESCLTKDLESAKLLAKRMLSDFYTRKYQEISNSNPELYIEEDE